MKIKRMFASIISAAVISLSSVTICGSNIAYADFSSNPVISRECPAYSSSGMAASANDKYYYSFWNSNGADYLAYDLSAVPKNERKRVIAVWYNATGQFDYTVLNGSSNGVPSDYTIEVNAAEGGSYPKDGWEIVETVTGNTLHSRQHVVDMEGYNWIRINISGNDGKTGGNTSINMDIHNVSDGISDSFIFYGDSITACGMMNCYGTGFAEYVNQIDGRYYPIQENGGIGGIRSIEGAENIDRWLESFPGKYVSIAYGTNDAWGNPSGTEQYYNNTEYMVKSILAAGKIPIIPTIPYAKESAVGDNVPAYNAMIEKIYEKYPQVIKGPDFYEFFKENPDLLSSDGVHPAENGYAEMRKLWAKTMYDAIYSSENPAPEKIKGDVNSDGKFDIADVVSLQKWLLTESDAKLADWQAGDLYEDDKINVLDLCVMKQKLISGEATSNEVYVENTDELKNALKNAKAGDEIILAEGEYVYSGDTPKGYMFTSSADGTEANPIIIRSENPEKPAILSGSSTSENYVLDISGDWWEIKDLKVTNAQKGIILDNSNHTEIINCEVYNIGSEGIHFRDNSSYCLAENCYVHDTGVVSPGYGEAVYVGSAKSTSGYGHDCHYNTIRNCKLGPNVAAEHVDIKEYTIGTTVENCTFDGTGMSGENFAKSFVNIKGNDCVIRNNVGYRNGCTAIQRAFEQNNVVDGWGQNATVYGNKVYMDTATNAFGKKMYFLNAWDCSATVWDNFMAYEGELFSVDNEDDHWKYYNCNLLTYESK